MGKTIEELRNEIAREKEKQSLNVEDQEKKDLEKELFELKHAKKIELANKFGNGLKKGLGVLSEKVYKGVNKTAVKVHGGINSASKKIYEKANEKQEEGTVKENFKFSVPDFDVPIMKVPDIGYR